MSLFSTLVDDLIRDPQLRRRFNLDPKGVISEYGLNPQQQRLLLSMDPTLVAASPDVPAPLKPAVNGFNFPAGEFPPASDDFLAEGGGLDPAYPSPAPGIFRYRTTPPLIYHKDTATNTIARGFSADIVNNTDDQSIELTVFGQSFVKDECELKLVRVTPSTVAQIANFHVLGTFRNAILRAVFTPPLGEPTWTVGHRYEVTVVNLAPPVQKTFKAKPLLEVLA